jgi:hypothetical protein
MRHLQNAIVGIALLIQLFLPSKADLTKAAQLTPSQDSQEGDTGNDLLLDCTYALRLLDGDTQITPGQSRTAFHCEGYIAGLIDGYSLAEDMEKYRGGSSHRLFCLPKEGLLGSQGVRIVVKWLREHPETLHQQRKVLVMLAFESAFPCK